MPFWRRVSTIAALAVLGSGLTVAGPAAATEPAPKPAVETAPVVEFSPIGTIKDGISCLGGDGWACVGVVPVVGKVARKVVQGAGRVVGGLRDAWRATDNVRDGVRTADNAGDAGRAADNAGDARRAADNGREARRAADNAGDAGRASPAGSRADVDSSPSASRSARDEVGATCSFTGDTAVVLADGSRKPISEVRVGDTVLAEDPETGERGARTVLHMWEHEEPWSTWRSTATS